MDMQDGGYGEQQVIRSHEDMYAQTINEDKIKNILSQINPSNQLEEVELRLKGYKRDNMTGEWEKKYEGVNELLVDRYVSWLSSIMGLNTTLGNLSAYQINGIMKQSLQWVIDDVDAHAEEYGLISDYTERTRVCDMIMNSTFLVLNRSLDGTEGRRFWKSLSLTESSSSQANNKNQGGDWWKFWKA